jgi:hypothetical protein
VHIELTLQQVLDFVQQLPTMHLKNFLENEWHFFGYFPNFLIFSPLKSRFEQIGNNFLLCFEQKNQ